MCACIVPISSPVAHNLMYGASSSDQCPEQRTTALAEMHRYPVLGQQGKGSEQVRNAILKGSRFPAHSH